MIRQCLVHWSVILFYSRIVSDSDAHCIWSLIVVHAHVLSCPSFSDAIFTYKPPSVLELSHACLKLDFKCIKTDLYSRIHFAFRWLSFLALTNSEDAGLQEEDALSIMQTDLWRKHCCPCSANWAVVVMKKNFLRISLVRRCTLCTTVLRNDQWWQSNALVFSTRRLCWVPEDFVQYQKT